jgi:hypothetical protein
MHSAMKDALPLAIDAASAEIGFFFAAARAGAVHFSPAPSASCVLIASAQLKQITVADRSDSLFMF